MFTIAPSRSPMKCSIAAWVQLKTLPKLTRITSSQSPGAMFAISASLVIPALLTRMWSPPRAAMVSRTRPAAWTGSLTSASRAIARPPAAAISATTSSAPARLLR